MPPILMAARRVLGWIGRLEMMLAVMILGGIVAMIVGQVLRNAGFGRPITWEQEAGAYGLVWMTFLGASVAWKQGRHVRIVSFVGWLPVRIRAVVRAVVLVVTIGTLGVLVRELGPIMRIEARATTIALPMDLPRAVFFSLPLMVASVSMILTSFLFLMEALWEAATGTAAADRGLPPAIDGPTT